MMKTIRRGITFVFTVVVAGIAASAQHPSHDRHKQQQDKSHHEGVDERGDRAMGFSHAKTTHHFRLKTDGGIIEVTAKDAADNASRDQIRRHLEHIAKKFAEGDFSAPMFIHAQTPPGVDVMKRLKAEIKYQFEEIEGGAQVRISSQSADAIKAIHAFLRFQIEDHRTGDPLDLK